MLAKAINILTRAFLIIIFFVLLISCLCVFYFDYDSVADTVLKIYGLEAKSDVVKSIFLTKEKFFLAKYILPLFLTIYSIIAYFIYSKTDRISTFLLEIVNELLLLSKKAIGEVHSLDRWEKIFFYSTLSLLIGFRLYFIQNYYIHTDEAFSYVFIVQKGILGIVSYYPGPNNHVFYLILVNLFENIMENVHWALRLPSFFAGALLFFVQFVLIKKYFGFNPALLTSVLFGFSEYGNFYAIHGRGYITLILFVVLSFYFLLSVNKKENYYFLFVAFSTLGFYTIPIFLYPFLTIVAFNLILLFGQKRIAEIKKFCIACFYIGFISFLLYLPIILLSGLDSIVGNRFVQNLDWSEFISQLPSYLWANCNVFYSEVKWTGIISITNIFLWAYLYFYPQKGKEIEILHLKKVSLFILLVYIIPLLTISVQRVLPFHRVWLYISFFEYTSLSIGISLLFPFHNKLIKFVLYPLTIFYIFFFFTHVKKQTINEKGPYGSIENFISKVAHIKHQSFYSTHDTYNVMLRYEAIIKNLNWKVYTEHNQSADFLILKKSDKKDFQPENYSLFISDGFVDIYKKRLPNN